MTGEGHQRAEMEKVRLQLESERVAKEAAEEAA